MKLNEMNIFVFLACMIVGILISMNISFGQTAQTKVLSSLQYKEAVAKRSKLYDDISFLQKQYSKNLSMLSQYNISNPSNEKIVESLRQELTSNRLILGYDAVEGKGVIITLNDASNTFAGNIQEDGVLQWSTLVHNTDVLEVVNELRVSGAEAISINGQRIMSNSEFYCWGPFLKINGVNIGAPFYISVIGNSDTIEKYLYADEGYLTFLKYRNIFINYDKEENVVIPGYIGNMKSEFMKEVKNN